MLSRSTPRPRGRVTCDDTEVEAAQANSSVARVHTLQAVVRSRSAADHHGHQQRHTSLGSVATSARWNGLHDRLVDRTRAETRNPTMRTHTAALYALAAILLAGCSSSANPPAAHATPSPAARGVEAPIDTIPWSQVGPGWVLATWSPLTGNRPGRRHLRARRGDQGRQRPPPLTASVRVRTRHAGQLRLVAHARKSIKTLLPLQFQWSHGAPKSSVVECMFESCRRRRWTRASR
jgi:hypothetical protein